MQYPDQVNLDIKELIATLRKESNATKEVATEAYLVIEKAVHEQEVSVAFATIKLSPKLRELGYPKKAPGTLVLYHSTVSWLIDQTGTITWLADRSYSEHELAAKRHWTFKDLTERHCTRKSDNGTKEESDLTVGISFTEYLVRTVGMADTAVKKTNEQIEDEDDPLRTVELVEARMDFEQMARAGHKGLRLVTDRS